VTILPGQTIGILGGGQLGRMFAIAARRMGYRVASFDPTQDCPTGQVADVEVTAAYDDVDAAVRFAQAVDVVTFEFENVPAETLAAIEKIRPVRPSPFVLDTCRHRLREKTFLQSNKFPLAEFRAARSVEELREAIGSIGFPCVVKTAAFGYDGKGQAKISSIDAVEGAWSGLGSAAANGAVVEQFVKFDREISVIVARTESGETRCFPPFENEHRNHILDVTTVPASLPPRLAKEAVELATAIAVKLEVVGLLTVEMFVETGGRLLVNELAPRPHNSGHVTFDAAVTSQFEQQLRAVCGLPLGDPTMLKPAAMANLLGDLWKGDRPLNFEAALWDRRVKLHLYGKHEAKPGRKMGHLVAIADSALTAREVVLSARERLIH
jgi:5-(carboxyamino)imidazole ribonucleotide synthase